MNAAINWLTSKTVAAEYSETGLRVFNGTLPAKMAADVRKWFAANGQYRDCGTQSAYSAHVGGFAYTLRHKISKSAYNTVIFTVEPECDPDQEQTVSWGAD